MCNFTSSSQPSWCPSCFASLTNDVMAQTSLPKMLPGIHPSSAVKPGRPPSPWWPTRRQVWQPWWAGGLQDAKHGREGPRGIGQVPNVAPGLLLLIYPTIRPRGTCEAPSISRHPCSTCVSHAAGCSAVRATTVLAKGMANPPSRSLLPYWGSMRWPLQSPASHTWPGLKVKKKRCYVGVEFF